MPVISTFFGIIVRMFHADHPPPHMHVSYGEFHAIIEVGSGKILNGHLPRRVLRLTQEWRRVHKDDLLHAWKDAMEHRSLKRIKPLE